MPSRRSRRARRAALFYEKQQNDLALELKILREADIKDKADAERDRRDKEEVRTKAKQMQEWNLKSAALKKAERKEGGNRRITTTPRILLGSRRTS